MAKRLNDRQLLAHEIESLDDSQVRTVLDYIIALETKRHTPVSRGLRDDELVAMLADAHENKRAQQAFAWEAARRRAERRATSLSTRA